MRKEGPMILTVISSLVVVFSVYFFLGQRLNLTETLNRWFQVSFAVALALGFINLAVIHWKYIQRRREGWFFSVVLLFVMYGYLVLGLLETHTGKYFDWVFVNIMATLSAAIYSLLAFLITSAAYRAFRVRTVEATILLVSAVFVMLGRTSIGDIVWGGWSDWVAKWVVDTVSMAAMRAIQIGAYVGAFATALRIMLGLERAHLGGTGTR